LNKAFKAESPSGFSSASYFLISLSIVSQFFLFFDEVG